MQHPRLARLAARLRAITREPAQHRVRREPRVRHAGQRPVKGDERRPAGRHGHGFHPRGERRAGSCERGGRGRRQREDDGGEIGVRGAAIVKERPSAAAALEPHDPGAVFDIEVTGEETRQRIHGGRADPEIASPFAVRPGRMPAPGRTRRFGSLQHCAKPGIRRRQELCAMVEGRNCEAPRREPSAGRALRLEHASLDTGFLQAPRACNAGKACADHGDRDGIHASLRFR